VQRLPQQASQDGCVVLARFKDVTLQMHSQLQITMAPAMLLPGIELQLVVLFLPRCLHSERTAFHTTDVGLRGYVSPFHPLHQWQHCLCVHNQRCSGLVMGQPSHCCVAFDGLSCTIKNGMSASPALLRVLDTCWHSCSVHVPVVYHDLTAVPPGSGMLWSFDQLSSIPCESPEPAHVKNTCQRQERRQRSAAVCLEIVVVRLVFCVM
jgi:hypothetical protein